MGTLPTEHTADLPAKDTTAQEKVKSMPLRSKKNSHPGIVAKGKTRRTSAQVAAEKAHEEEARKKAEAEETANLQTLAQLNVREDCHRALQKTRAELAFKSPVKSSYWVPNMVNETLTG